MAKRVDIDALLHGTRAQVYLLWAVLVAVGYVATHFYQVRQINGLWFVLSIIGLGHMYRVMPLKVKQMKRIYAAWLIPIAFGMVVSGLAFYLPALTPLIAYLGAFWLLVQAVAFACNGIVDPPSKWYYIAAVVNAAAAVACYMLPGLLSVQYLVAAAVSSWSMLMLWLFRTD